jgi:hypothetical protein
MLDKMVELETSYNEVIQMPIEERETAKKARELRLKYMKIRTATLDIHKKQKAFYLAGGKFVDGWKNAQHFASMGKEEKLEEIEKYAENLEKQRIADLQKSREEQLQPYGVENVETLNLGVMPDSVWDNFLAGTITNYNAKIQAEKDAAEAEKKRLQEEEAEREKVRIENEKLKEAAELLKQLRDKRSKELAPYITFVRDFNAALELSDEDFAAVLADAKAAKESHDEIEKLKAEEEEKERNRLIDEQKKKNIEEAKKRKEAEEQAAKLQKELDDRKRKEEEAERQAEAELSKGDKEKMLSLIADLNELKTKYQFKSKKHKALYESVKELISKTVAYAESKQ